MSYFVVVVLQQGKPKQLLFNDVALICLDKAQDYVKGFLLSSGLLTNEELGRAYLVTDETRDTSSNLVSEIQRQTLIEGIPLDETRFGQLVTLAADNHWSLLVWWAGEERTREIVCQRFSDKGAFFENVLKQITSTGDVFAAFSPL